VRGPISFGGRTVRLKPNCPSRRRISCSSAISMRLRTIAVRWSGGSRARRGLAGRLSQVKAQTMAPSRNTIAASPAPVRMVR
jgi:hypothetical protein